MYKIPSLDKKFCIVYTEQIPQNSTAAVEEAAATKKNEKKN